MVDVATQRAEELRALCLRRQQYLKTVRICCQNNCQIPDNPIWHNSPFGAELVLPVEHFEPDVTFALVFSLIDDEMSSLNNIIDLFSRTEKSSDNLSTHLRILELEDKIPDCRAVCQTYIEKQDVEYCTVGMDNVERLCCKTAAFEIANTFIGCPVEEQTLENYTLWFLRTARYNMTQEDKYNCLEGTIRYANKLIRTQRKVLDLPLTHKPSVFDRITTVLSTFKDSWKSDKTLPLAPRIIQSTRLLAALPYGIFGVRPMRPVKQDF